MLTETSQLLTIVLSQRDTLSADEQSALESLPVRPKVFEHGDIIVPRGPCSDESCLIVSGMALRMQPAYNGEPIASALHIPGDFVDLHAFVLDDLDHSVIAQGHCKVHFVRREHLMAVTTQHPHLTRLLWMLTLIDAKINRTWLATRANLKASQRIGHFLCELHTRYSLIGFARNGSFSMPLGQQDLRYVLGYSKTHINRAVQQLRSLGLVEWTNGQVRLHDLEALKAYSEFDPRYLEITRVRR